MDFASMVGIHDSPASDIKTKAHAATLDVLKPSWWCWATPAAWQ